MKFFESFCVIFLIFCYVKGEIDVPEKSSPLESSTEVIKPTNNEKQSLVRRAARKCVQQEKIRYTVVVAFAKGDLKDEKPKSKCFLKCFAEKLELINGETGEPNRDKMIEYLDYLKPSETTYSDYVDSCLAQEERGDNLCDYVYRCYKCFWAKLKNQPEPESVRLSFYDVLGFNEAFDEGEIIEEEVYKVLDEQAEGKP